MYHRLRQLIADFRTRLPSWLGGGHGPATGKEEAGWALVDAVQAVRQLSADFRCEPLPAGDPRFVARDDALERLGAVIERWKRGRPVMVAVTGPQGCGITSLLNQVPGLLTDDTVLRAEQFVERLRDPADVLPFIARLFDMETPPATEEALIAHINAIEPRVLVLDNAHFLAFRVMGAGGAAHKLGAIMVATQQRHLWIMGCRRQAWRRLMYLHQVERFFTDILELEYFNAEQLGEAITARRPADGEEASARDFQRLHELCRGKPDLGFLYFECGARTEAGGYRPLDVSVLKQLTVEDLFTLAELAVHGSMQLDEHGLIFRVTPEISQMQLNQLCGWGLVECLDGNGGSPRTRFRLTPILSAIVSEHLYKSNYLY